MRSEFSALFSIFAPLADFSRVVASFVWARRGSCVSACVFFALALLCGAVGPVFGALLALALAVAAPLCVAVAALAASGPSEAWQFSYLDRTLDDTQRDCEGAALAEVCASMSGGILTPFARGSLVVFLLAGVLVSVVGVSMASVGASFAFAVVGCCYVAFFVDAVRV